MVRICHSTCKPFAQSLRIQGLSDQCCSCLIVLVKVKMTEMANQVGCVYRSQKQSVSSSVKHQFNIERERGKREVANHFVTISVGAALVLLSWSTWPFVLTACHVFLCHRGVDSAPLVILFANSPSSPALYFVLIISPLSCPRVCCLMSVRMRYSEC